MIVTTIADPSALDQKYLDDNAYLLQTREFLKRILTSNTLLVLDKDGVLLREMGERIRTLKNEKKLSLLFEEILKNRNSRIVIYKVPVSNSGIKDLCWKLERHNPPDALITNPDHIEYFQKFCTESKVVDLSKFLQSDFEEEREEYSQPEPLHLLNESKRRDLFIRIVQFAKYLRIYDKQIGRANNLPNFFRGIHYILSLWKDHGYYQSEKNAQVEIYTTGPYLPWNSTQEERREIVGKLKSDLLEKLRHEFDWRIRLHIKDDPKHEFHARYLQTQSAIILMERGFDFIKKNGRDFKQTVVHLTPKASEHLLEFRTLRNFKC